MADIFWQWWVTLNAPARALTNSRLTPGAEGADIAIETLRVPGKQGWLTVLYALSVWRTIIGDGDAEDWKKAVVDVEWVTRRLSELAYQGPNDLPLKRLVILLIYLLHKYSLIDVQDIQYLQRRLRASPQEGSQIHQLSCMIFVSTLSLLFLPDLICISTCITVSHFHPLVALDM